MSQKMPIYILMPCPKSYRVLIALSCLFVLIGHGLRPVEAQEWKQSLDASIRAGKDYWEATPVQSPLTGHYYQLVRDQRNLDGHNVSFWKRANNTARSMTFRGRNGRLAVIDSPELYDWILEQWDVGSIQYDGDTWIGLRYWCNFRKLTWSDGSTHPFGAFGPWDAQWYRNGDIRCGVNAMDYMPVYISKNTRRWKAAGQMKGYAYFLVEYPPSKTAADQAKASTDESPE
ncbi:MULTISPECIES: C-type lectin domain-containing protein [unclassified Iodidimonas]|jgi:hypothetical protein|uniref:C-type lectin domain-containing protein n=1 Tax=unclassified Iodidimonas TaxID=2626145 RepID=UPI002482AF84|nr:MULTISPECIES: C-type lectin domain-containing protein [unclassified Iodidimonas]